MLRASAWIGAGVVAWVVACADGSGLVDGGFDGGLDGGADGGATADAGPDAGSTDGGEDGGSAVDAGMDATDVDAGVDAGLTFLPLRGGPPLPPPDRLVGPAQGLPEEVVDASLDDAGHLWAVSAHGLHVLREGAGAVETFGDADGLSGDELLAVVGTEAGMAWIGARGQGDANEDPEWMRHTGGVARVKLDGAGLRVKQFELASEPGRYPQYPDGRYKLRTCYRAYATRTGPNAGEVWFGCNHGIGMIDAAGVVFEHHHPAYCEWHPETATCTLHTGDVPAVAFTPGGDVWFGGTYGVGRLDYTHDGRADFWGPEPVRDLPLLAAPLGSNAYGSVDVVGLAHGPDGSLWAATLHSGLVRLRPDGAVDHWRTSDGLPENELIDVAVDASGLVWIATASEGVHRLDPATGALRDASGLPSRFAARVAAIEGPRPAVVVVVRGGVAIYANPP